MRASCSLQLDQAFLLDEEHIKKLCKLLDGRIGPVEIKAACVDRVEREFKDVADLVKYENTKEAEIDKLSMTAWSENREKRASLVFAGDPTRLRGVFLDIAADDGVVLRLKSDILDIVSGTRPWFSRLSGTHFDLFFLMGSVVLFPLAGPLVASKLRPLSITFKQNPTPAETAIASIIICVFMGAYIASAWGTYKVVKGVFPQSVFLLGQRRGRYKIIELLQWCVVIAFFVSLAAGMVSTILLTSFK